jgi:hypothetical protein
MNHPKSGHQGSPELPPHGHDGHGDGASEPKKSPDSASAEQQFAPDGQPVGGKPVQSRHEVPAHPTTEGVGKRHGQQPADLADPRQSKDILPIIRGWDYEAGSINVRKVHGADGQPKLQMRLDLGLLQMEMNGRPDGRRPFGYESLLEYHEKKLADHRRRTGSEDGFELSTSECQSLREEAVMYYQRYLSLFVLEEFPGVVRDTARNLKVLDLCNRFAIDDDDRMVLEQYRPYITMMNARAKASIHVKEKRYREALTCIDAGLSIIRDFFERFGRPEAFGHANEVKLLKRLARSIRKKLPVDPMKRLRKRLDRAVREERYEMAARIRDKIAALKGQPEGPPSAHG